MAKAEADVITTTKAAVIDFGAYKAADEAKRAELRPAFEPTTWPDADLTCLAGVLRLTARRMRGGGLPVSISLPDLLDKLALNAECASKNVFSLEKAIRKAERKRAKKKARKR